MRVQCACKVSSDLSVCSIQPRLENQEIGLGSFADSLDTYCTNGDSLAARPQFVHRSKIGLIPAQSAILKYIIAISQQLNPSNYFVAFSRVQ